MSVRYHVQRNPFAVPSDEWPWQVTDEQGPDGSPRPVAWGRTREDAERRCRAISDGSYVRVVGGSFTADPKTGHLGWLVAVSVVRGWTTYYEVQLAESLECIWLEREEFVKEGSR